MSNIMSLTKEEIHVTNVDRTDTNQLFRLILKIAIPTRFDVIYTVFTYIIFYSPNHKKVNPPYELTAKITVQQMKEQSRRIFWTSKNDKYLEMNIESKVSKIHADES